MIMIMKRRAMILQKRITNYSDDIQQSRTYFRAPDCCIICQSDIPEQAVNLLINQSVNNIKYFL